jgi:hypothetical protein
VDTERNPEELFCLLTTVEEKYGLLDRTVKDVFFWKLLRFDLFCELSVKCGMHTPAHPKKEKGWRRFFNMLLAYIFQPALSEKNPVDVLLFPHTREVCIDGLHSDIYSFEYEKNWSHCNVSYSRIIRAQSSNVSFFNTGAIQHDVIRKGKIARGVKRRNEWCHALPEDILHILQKVQEDFVSFHPALASVDNLSTGSILRRINRFAVEYHHYYTLLRQRAPKKIYLVVGYGRKHALLAAAAKLQIPTIEIQHGTIIPQHTGYSFPGRETVPYFPDQIDLWGRYWADITPLPSKVILNIAGFPYFHKKKAQSRHTREHTGEVLFISQGTIGFRLQLIAREFAEKYPGYTIVYRMHPSEYKVRYSRYSGLMDAAAQLNNLHISDNKKDDLYTSFARAEYVVGVYSTALIEALALQCRLILIDYPGVEYFSYITAQKMVPISAPSPEDLKKSIDEYAAGKYEIDPDYFITG